MSTPRDTEGANLRLLVPRRSPGCAVIWGSIAFGIALGSVRAPQQS